MNIATLLKWGFNRLKDTSTSALLDSEVLLSFALKKPREFLFTHPEKKLTNLKLSAKGGSASGGKTYKLLIKRRAKSEPVAYLTGHKEFYGLDFLVSRAVLIPRPETELLVDEVKNLLTIKPFNHLTIIDVGTGNGCIPITIMKTLKHKNIKTKNINLYATDVSKKALTIARFNARHHDVADQITFLKGNLLHPLIQSKILNTKYLILNTLIITANLPYLTTRQWRQTPPDVRLYEPRQALDAGHDDLKYFRELFSQIKQLLTAYSLRLTAFLEIDPAQTKKIKGLAKKYLPSASFKIKKDLAGRGRVVIIKLYQKSPARAI